MFKSADFPRCQISGKHICIVANLVSNSQTWISYSEHKDVVILIGLNLRLGLPCIFVPSTYIAVTVAGSAGMMGVW